MAPKRILTAGRALAVEKGGTLWVAGLAPAGPPQERIPQDVGAQLRDILGQLDQLLLQAGGGPQDVVKTVDYLIPPGLPEYRATAEVRRDYFQGRFPASTGILMEGLLQQDAMIEVDVVAHLGPGQRRETVPADERASRLTFRAAVEKGGLLWVSGTTGRRYDPRAGAEVYPADLTDQVQIVYEKQLQALQELDYSYADVVKMVTYLSPAGLATHRHVDDVRRSFFGDRFPVSTAVVVNRLLRPEAMVEIDMVAAKGLREVVDPGWDRYRNLTYSPAIKVGNMLFMSGFAALDPMRNEIVGDGDLAAQAEQAYLLVAGAVEAAGGSLADVVKVVEYHVPATQDQTDRVAAVRRQFLQDGGYALTQIVVQALARPEMLIEVEAVAVLG